MGVQLIQIPYTLGHDVAQNPYHLSVIRTRLVRNAGRMFDDVHDEVVAAFSDQVPLAKGASGEEIHVLGTCPFFDCLSPAFRQSG